MFRNVNNMDDLVLALTGLEEIIIMGNSEHINQLDPEKIKGIVSIGVNRIGLKYTPDVLLWVDVWEKDLQILIDTKSPIKICRERRFSMVMPESPDCSFFQFSTVESFGHEWGGGLKLAPSICTAIHLAMVCKIASIYVAGVDLASNRYFWGATQPGSENGKYNKGAVRSMRQYYDMIEKANNQCKIWFCSKKTVIKNFEITNRFDKQ